MSFILSVDVGSTTVSAAIFDEKGERVSFSSSKYEYISPSPGLAEIDPSHLWDTLLKVIKDVIAKGNLGASDLNTFGISSQRGTFILWDRDSGKPYINFISWLDNRADQIAKDINNGLVRLGVNAVGSIGYAFTGAKRTILAKILNVKGIYACTKVGWAIQNIPEVARAHDEGRLMFGSIDSWLVHKLTKGKLHVTDYSFASSTAMWDPFQRDWSGLIKWLCGIKSMVYPSYTDSIGDICIVDKEWFGAEFPVNALIGDQMASMFAANCFEKGDMLCSMGTGMFISCNTGSYVHASLSGLYPQVAWKHGDEVVYMCEGQAKGISASIEWAKKIGYFDDVSETAAIAKSVPDSDGICFVPGFFGLETPYQDELSCAGLLGIRSTSTKAHIVRAILEAIAFRFYEIHLCSISEIQVPFRSLIKICGGVSQNDFVLELMSALTNCTIVRVKHAKEMTVRGAAYMAGIGAGIFSSKEDVIPFLQSDKEVHPDQALRKIYLEKYNTWKRAVEKCLSWYPPK